VGGFLYICIMNHKLVYDNLISKAKLENRSKGGEIYYEAHHIIPKCMGGEGKESQWKYHPNVVLLTAREHFICHKLLIEIYPKNHSLIWALHRMMFSKKGNVDRDYVPSSRDYENFRIIFSNTVKEQQTGVPKSSSHRVNLSLSKTGTKMPESFVLNLREIMKGENNPNYGNKWTNEMKKESSEKRKGIPNKVVWTEEMREESSKKRKGIYNGTEESKKKISETLTGRKDSDETKKKKSESRRQYFANNPNTSVGPQKIVVCPHCSKSGGTSNMSRYHFDNCKFKS
jgi:hypothetical protein